MLFSQLKEAGDARTQALTALKEAQDNKLSPKQFKKLAAEATRAVVAYEQLIQPENLLPYVLRLLHDATRYRHFREDATVDDWQRCTLIKGKDLDALVDELVELNFTKPDQGELL